MTLFYSETIKCIRFNLIEQDDSNWNSHFLFSPRHKHNSNSSTKLSFSDDTHHEGTTAGVSLPDGEAEPHHRRDHRRVQRPPARIGPDLVEDQQAGIVSRVDHWADLNGQVDGRRATNHGDIGVF